MPDTDTINYEMPMLHILRIAFTISFPHAKLIDKTTMGSE